MSESLVWIVFEYESINASMFGRGCQTIPGALYSVSVKHAETEEEAIQKAAGGSDGFYAAMQVPQLEPRRVTVKTTVEITDPEGKR